MPNNRQTISEKTQEIQQRTTVVGTIFFKR